MDRDTYYATSDRLFGQLPKELQDAVRGFSWDEKAGTGLAVHSFAVRRVFDMAVHDGSSYQTFINRLAVVLFQQNNELFDQAIELAMRSPTVHPMTLPRGKEG